MRYWIIIELYKNFNVDLNSCDALRYILLIVINWNEQNSRGFWHGEVSINAMVERITDVLVLAPPVSIRNI